ncbi:RusA family crossover junction endodeoxyribonuclease [Flavobacterium sp. KS-LB2]|uniref:RusA family crossover junction endodeoxyribonuclease n=1 Tax=Flavobacterium sp. KS-LB2 TaxID=3120525 RepID=UPI0030D05197
MKIQVETENCNLQKYYNIEEFADSQIKITLRFDKIISRQSRKTSIDKLSGLIQSELSKFKWIIVGSILVDLTWYLNAVERQETDKIGDIDNITKPIIDSLSGENGVFVDDSQIGGLYSYWITRNDIYEDNVLVIQIKFNNDYVLYKENLKFIQYSNATCMPLNIDLNSKKDLFVAKILIASRNKLRKAASIIKSKGTNVDKYFVCSEYEFHRTRLSGFNSKSILTTDQVNKAIKNVNIKFSDVRKILINNKANKSNDIQSEI